MITNSYITTLSIAGSDCSGGAGIQADLKTFAALGCYGMSVITAITAQNTQQVSAIAAVSSEMVTQQLEAINNDIKINAIKIGMLHNSEIIKAVAAFVKHLRNIPIILDPVMIAKSGVALIDDSAVSALKLYLLPYVSMVTPNIPEAEILTGISINNEHAMIDAAINLANTYNISVYLKGGHLENSNTAPDLFYYYNDKTTHWFTAEKIITKNTHGTGCSLSSAICANLALDLPMLTAVEKAKEYITAAIRYGAVKQLGNGYGPIDHFYNWSSFSKLQNTG